MTKDQKQFEEQLARAYLKGRIDAQRELYGLIHALEVELARYRPKNKRSARKGKAVN